MTDRRGILVPTKVTQKPIRVHGHHTSGGWTLAGCPNPDLERVVGYEGITAPEGARCEALSESKGRRCPKDAAILLVLDEDYGDHDPLALCGGHFGVHRRGRAILIPER